MSFGFGFGFPRRVGAALRAALDFNFLSGELDPRITFSRTSNATLIGSDGTLQYAPHNLLTYSEQFDNAVWAVTAATISANAVSAPNGTQTADQLVETVGTGTLPRLPIPITLNVGQTYSASVYAKEVPGSSKRYLQVYFNAGFASVPCGANFNLATGTVTYSSGLASTSVENVGNGWWRCTINTTVVLVGATGFRIALVDNPTQVMSLAWNPDGTGSMYLWGAQLNVGSLQPYYSTTVKNLQGYSQEFDDAAWSKSNSTITADVTAAPDGSVTADKLVEDTVTIGHYITPGISSALVVGQVVTYSVYAKAAERTFLQLILTSVGPASANLVAGFGLTTGIAGTPSAGSTSSIVAVGDGWYRCSITVPVATAGTPLRQIRLAQNSSSTPSSYTGDGTSGIFIWGAQFSDSASLDPYVYNPAAAPSNTAYYGPRLDYDPVTLAPKGRLIEEQRTNSIRNNTMQGAVAGTPGTAPTTWSLISGGGLSREVVSIGTESGISYIDVRFFGTPSSIAAQRVYVESSFTISAADGQAWSLSAYVKLVAGTAPSGLFIGFDETGPGATYIKTDQANLPLTSTLTRAKYSATLSGGVNVAYVIPQIGFNSEIGVAVDFTLRIGLPQLEQGAFATSVIPTTTAAATRAADILSIIGANFSNWYNPVEGTMVAEFSHFRPGGFPAVASINNGSLSDRINLIAGGGNLFRGSVVTASVSQADMSTGTYTLNSVGKLAVAVKANDFALAASNGALQTDTSGTMPTVDRLQLGFQSGGLDVLNGHIRSFKYYNTRLSNGQLQSLTALPAAVPRLAHTLLQIGLTTQTPS